MFFWILDSKSYLILVVNVDYFQLSAGQTPESKKFWILDLVLDFEIQIQIQKSKISKNQIQNLIQKSKISKNQIQKNPKFLDFLDLKIFLNWFFIKTCSLIDKIIWPQRFGIQLISLILFQTKINVIFMKGFI